jgi:hypothetical protein
MIRFLRQGSLALLLGLTMLLSPIAAHAADVWVNTGSHVYHCPGTQYYGNTKRGLYLSESEAISRGYRAAHNRVCSPAEASDTRLRLQQSFGPNTPASEVKVWINIASHVYHCPGTRYYGATKHGHFSSEAEAISSGNRPAHGARCN